MISWRKNNSTSRKAEVKIIECHARELGIREVPTLYT